MFSQYMYKRLERTLLFYGIRVMYGAIRTYVYARTYKSDHNLRVTIFETRQTV
jgi:hypothetical protein